MDRLHSTTILCVRRDGQVAMAGDGQVSFGNTVIKQKACKIRRAAKHPVLAGFAGGAADGFALFERFEAKLEEFRGNVTRATVELAKDWRMDRQLRKLEAMLIVADRDQSFLLSGVGDIVEPDDGIVAVGSGGPYATAAARALLRHTALSARAIVTEGLRIAGELCIYTNLELTVEEL
ncbi:MAG: ATP-dependent protease subunit HslV [Deltaproteobacteria bacterium]|nr:ATP-dependent protease subunit HslV [Deltaproteobacteria bacterium]